MTEVWLRGPLAGHDPLLMPVAHALLQVREDLERVVSGVSAEELWRSPGDAAPAGYHLQHLTGSLDRLLTYARGEPLSDTQRLALAGEKRQGASAAELLIAAQAAIDQALDQVRRTQADSLLDAREVGRSRLPSTVLGLLAHAAEHTARHTGQIVTTLKVVRGPASGQAGSVG